VYYTSIAYYHLSNGYERYFFGILSISRGYFIAIDIGLAKNMLLQSNE